MQFVEIRKLVSEQVQLWKLVRGVGDEVDAFNHKFRARMRREGRKFRRSEEWRKRMERSGWGPEGRWQMEGEEDEEGVYIVRPENGSWELPWLADVAREVEEQQRVEVEVEERVYTEAEEREEWARLEWGISYEEAKEWGYQAGRRSSK